ncbi:putative Xaa-Pro dipeptidase [Clavispora lusitaniae]|uniref:Xaa-Pro dipeptidase n=1 Tax=Clavispora lusitaniae TaxID=36911 RepID=A0AA91Q1U9_CLALS|nr:putative Xaa-Pro dipeptidase [Clavispora lusitaniae]
MPFGPKSLEGRKYPAKEHAKRVYKHFREKNDAKRVSFFMSGEDLELYQYCDQTKPIRQNRYFFYLSGCEVPGSHVLYNAETDKLTLFLPNIDYEDVMWSGMPLSIEDALKKFDVDSVKYVDSLEEALQALSSDGFTIFTTDFNKWNDKFKRFMTEQSPDFFYALDEARMIKDDFEIELMKHASAITDKCHLGVMSATPIETNETHIHAEFMYHALRQGSKYQSYDPICCSGPNCSTLHYVKNDDEIDNKRSILIDAGAEWSCYASDVTRCFPINGDWTKEHLEIYNIVLKMQKATMALIKPGASWDDIHLEAHKVMIREFINLGIFKNFPEEEIFDSNISARFFPHGLGHLLGMDTHDVGGYPNYEDPDPKLRYLRLRRNLKEGMVLTDEPGVYFSPFLLKDILEDETKMKYINKDVLDKYWYIGGVRIEDDLLITRDGFENFTKITSDPAEITKIIKDSIAKGKEHFHNIV